MRRAPGLFVVTGLVAAILTLATVGASATGVPANRAATAPITAQDRKADMPVLPLASGRSCAQRRAFIDAAGAGTSVAVGAEEITAGEHISLAWRRADMAEQEPVFLLVSFDQPVRLAGTGFYGLQGGADAPFGIGWDRDRTRAVIPYYGPGQPASGEVLVSPVRAAPLDLRWTVVGHNGCAVHAATAGGGEADLRIRSASVPEIVVNDPFTLGEPERVLLSPDGTRRLEIHDGRYRLLDAATDAEVAEKIGGEPRFSPTGRFVVAGIGRGRVMSDRERSRDTDSYGGPEYASGYEVSDAVDGRALYTGGFIQAWHNADSVLLIAESGWGRASIYDTVTAQAMAQDFDLDECHACVVDLQKAYRPDPENNLILFRKDGISGRGDAFVIQMATKEFVDAPAEQIEPLVARVGVLRGLSSRNDPDPALLYTHAFAAGLPPGAGLEAHVVVPIHAPVSAGGDAQAGGGAVTVAMNWRGAMRLEPEDCMDPIGCDGESASARQLDASMTERLGEMGLRFAPTGPYEVFRAHRPLNSAYYDDKADFSEELFQAQQAEDEALFDRITARITAETGLPAGLWQNRMEFDCHPEEGHELRQFDVAWRWLHEGEIYWLTTTQCTAGNAGYLFPTTNLYSSGVAGGKVALADGILRRDEEGTVCPMALDACGFEIEIYRDRILVRSRKALGMALIDASNGTSLLTRFDLPRGDLLTRALLTEDGRHIAALQDDGSFTVVRIEDGEIVLQGRYADDEVVAWSGDRRFDATSEGAHLVSFRFPGRVGEYTFQQFDEALRVPGLVAQVLAGGYAAAAPGITPPPTLAATVGLPDGAAAATVALEARAAGIAALEGLQVFQDGLLTDRFAAPGAATQAAWAERIDRLPGTRWVSLVATDENGVTSLSMGRDLGPEGPGGRRVHVLAIGIDAYDAPGLPDLAVAQADARTFADTLSAASQGAGTDVAVASRTLLLGAEATPGRILGEIERLVTTSAPGETVAVFFAGHGVQGDDGAYYLATAGARPDDFAGTAVAWTRLASILARSRTRVAIFLDSCHSGAAGSSFFATNDDAAASILDRVPSGIVIFSASKGRQQAGEDVGLGGGFFTKALQEALATNRAATDLNGNGAIEISELYGAVKRSVVARTAGRQTPWFARNEMVGDFALF